MGAQEQRTKKDEYDQEYKKANYDQIAFRVRKGKKEEYQQAAEDFGLGQAEMIRLAIEDFIARRGYEIILPPKPPSKEQTLTAADKRLVEEFNQLPDEVKSTVRKLIQQINQNSPK